MIYDKARQAIYDLSQREPFGGLTITYACLAQVTGLSESGINKFYSKAKPNPTIKTLDAIVKGVEHLNKVADGYEVQLSKRVKK